MSRHLDDIRGPEGLGPASRLGPVDGGGDRGIGRTADDRLAVAPRRDRVDALLERAVADRDRPVVLSTRAEATVMEIGTFRALRVDDLARYRYDGDQGAMARDLRRLEHMGFVSQHRLSGRRGRPLDVVVLTEAGKRWAEGRPSMEAGDARQVLHAGLVKAREVVHEVAIYRMYQAERARLAGEGARVRRVLLDYELKRQVFSAAGSGASRMPDRCQQQAAAGVQGLRIVDGKVAFPDLRIEYENAGGDLGRVDLELTTEHYKAGQLRAKAEAGFRIYVAGPPSARMAAVFEERDITVAILEL